MTYADFKALYESLVTNLLKYSIEQVGSGHYAAQLAKLTDEHPEFEAQYDAEQDALPGASLGWMVL